MSTNIARPSRPLAAHEKHFLSRSRAGLPTIVVLGAEYSSAIQAPTRQFLAGRIGELQAHFPALYAEFGNGEDGRVVAREQGPWPATMIIQDSRYKADDGIEGEGFAKLLLDEGNRMSRDVSQNDHPLWQVGVHTHPSHSRGYITLSLDHILADGHGALRLFQAVLAPSIADLPFEHLESIPSFECTIQVSSPLGSHGDHVKPPPDAFWPNIPPKVSLSQAPPAVSILSLPIEELSLLKTAAKAHGVPTLHPVLKTIYSFALWSVYRQGSPCLRLASSTPRSERNLALGHAYCTGNYVCAHKFDIAIWEGQNFWDVARKVLDQINDPVDLARARAASGPHPPPQPKPWAMPAPFTQSFSFSNLGLSNLPAGAEDMSWMVFPTENGKGPLSVMVIGFEKGLRVCTSWRDGGAVEAKEVKDVERTFQKVVRRLIKGEDVADSLVE